MAGRGASGIRMWKKAAIVKPVDPRPDKNGVKQPAYLRSHSAAQSSRTLKAYQSFMRKCMSGRKFKNRISVRKAFATCAHKWKSMQGTAAAEYDFSSGEDEELFWE